MDFENAMPALVNWAKAGTGLSQVVWQNDRQPRKQKAYAQLSFASVTTEGHDEVSYVDIGTDTPKKVSPEIYGLRISSILCTVVSYVHEPTQFAPYYGEAWRARTLLPSQLATLKAAGMALVDASDLTVSTVEIDDYLVTLASFTVRVRTTVKVAATVELATETIESIELTTDIDDADGLPLPDDLQLDKEEIPA